MNQMKLKIVFFILMLSFSATIFAQDNKKFWYGPKFGLDVSSTEINEENLLNELRANYSAGIFMQFGKKLFLQPELYFVSYKDGNTALNYLKAPIMLGLKVLDLGLLSIHLNGGPSFSKLLSTDELFDTTPALNWQLGAGVNFLGFITTDLRYTLPNGTLNVVGQIENIIRNGGIVNLTVGLRL
jgi:hypothetical protein